MDCDKILQIPIVEKAITDPEERSLRENIFHCIYKSFKKSFIEWILAKYGGNLPDKNEAKQIALDAFQDAMYKLFLYVNKYGLKPNATLRTIVFSFGYWCFLGVYRKRGRNLGRFISFDGISETSGNEAVEGLATIISNENIYWDEPMQMLLTEEEYMLAQGIRRIPDEKWQRIAFLRYFIHLKPPEIASQLSVSRQYVDNILSKVKARLKEILKSKINS